MELKDHYAALRTIHAELAAIAEQTKTMADRNLADPSNYDWISIMNRQDDLLHELGRLNAQPLEP